MVTKTLDAMTRGGIYDRIGGGFHRYATDRHWHVPHFEKMLYDNAQLLHVYARAYVVTGNERYRQVALGIAAFVERVMTAESGLFYSALNAETAGEEGRYYTWKRDELNQLLGESAYRLAVTLWGLDGEPDHQGKQVLHRTQPLADLAQKRGIELASLRQQVEMLRREMLKARLERPMPLLDDKIVTSWNGLMIEALAFAGAALDAPVLIDRAERAGSAMEKALYGPEGTLRHVARNGETAIAARASDYGALLNAYMELARVTDHSRWEQQAGAVADAMIERLWDKESGGFFRTPQSAGLLLVRSKGFRDGVRPSGNALAVRGLLRLARAGHTQYRDRARATLRVARQRLTRYPQSAPALLAALEQFHKNKETAGRETEPSLAPRSSLP